MNSSDKASQERAAQSSILASIIHEKSTDPEIPGLVSQAMADLFPEDIVLSSADDDSVEKKDAKRILELTQDEYNKKNCISSELAARKAKLSSEAYSSWVKARTAKDYSIFSPVLSDCFEIVKEITQAQRDGKSATDGESQQQGSLYTDMLDEYEMGMKADRIDDMFATVEDALVPLIAKVLDSKKVPATDLLNGDFDKEKLKAMNAEIVTAMGFDVDEGRIDESVHPFTMAVSPSDVRITSRYADGEWYQSLAATVHEGGHAMYEQNLGRSGLSIDSFLSMGAHESQSLFWERHVSKCKEFCRWCTPLLQKNLLGENMKPEDADKYTPEAIYAAINAVSPGPIRVESDELTYPLHVILRYNIERDVINGKLSVDDIPKRWNEEMKKTLGVDITSDDIGCLQDVHWSALAIGYFPTYLIGGITAAQLVHYCQKDVESYSSDIENGEFGAIKAWLTDKVHRHGKRYKSLDELLEDQLGEKLNPKYYIDYLTEKYTELYDC